MLVLPGSGRVWLGADDGGIWVWDGLSEQLLGSSKPHTQDWAVTALAVVGREVWSACERCLAAHDPDTASVLYTLPLLEASAGFVKSLVPWQWGLWVLSINGLRLLATRAAWEALQQQVEGLGREGREGGREALRYDVVGRKEVGGVWYTAAFPPNRPRHACQASHGVGWMEGDDTSLSKHAYLCSFFLVLLVAVPSILSACLVLWAVVGCRRPCAPPSCTTLNVTWLPARCWACSRQCRSTSRGSSWGT